MTLAYPGKLRVYVHAGMFGGVQFDHGDILGECSVAAHKRLQCCDNPLCQIQRPGLLRVLVRPMSMSTA